METKIKMSNICKFRSVHMSYYVSNDDVFLIFLQNCLPDPSLLPVFKQS